MIKLLALDMDGTCLNSEVQLKPETKEAIEKAIARGVVVIPTSGRTFSILPPEVLQISGIDYAITSNGAVIQNVATGEEIFRQVLSNEDVQKALKLVERFNPFLEFYSRGKAYISESSRKRLSEFIPEEYLNFYEERIEVISDQEAERCEVFV